MWRAYGTSTMARLMHHCAGTPSVPYILWISIACLTTICNTISSSTFKAWYLLRAPPQYRYSGLLTLSIYLNEKQLRLSRKQNKKVQTKTKTSTEAKRIKKDFHGSKTNGKMSEESRDSSAKKKEKKNKKGGGTPTGDNQTDLFTEGNHSSTKEAKSSTEEGETVDADALMKQLEELAKATKNDTEWKSSTRKHLNTMREIQPILMDLMYDLNDNFKKARCRELILRSNEGRHEDEHSHPESTDLEVVAEEAVMAFIKEEQWYNYEWKLILEATKVEFPKGRTTNLNIQERVLLLYDAIIPMRDRMPLLVERIEKLEKSKSMDKRKFLDLRDRCELLLDKEDEARNRRDGNDVMNGRTPGLPFGLVPAPSPAPSFVRNTTVTDSQAPEPSTGQGQTGAQTGTKAGVPQTALMQTFSLKTLETLNPDDVKAWVTAARQLPSDLEATAIQQWLTTKVVRQLDICGYTDSEFAGWKVMNKSELVLLFEEKILKGQKDKYVKSMDELFETITIKLDPHNLSIQGLAVAFDEVMEKFLRFQDQIALAESEQATWKQLFQLLLKLWEQGHLKKGSVWNNGTAGTTKLRAAVAVTVKARCLLPKDDPRRIKTARDLMIEIMREVVARQEVFQSSLAVYLEMAENYMSEPRNQYPAGKKQKTDHGPGGGAGQGALKGGQGAPLGPRVACTCGKTHAGECRTKGIPPGDVPTVPNKPSLGMQLNNTSSNKKLRALQSGKDSSKIKKVKAKKFDMSTYKPKG